MVINIKLTTKTVTVKCNIFAKMVTYKMNRKKINNKNLELLIEKSKLQTQRSQDLIEKAEEIIKSVNSKSLKGKI